MENKRQTKMSARWSSIVVAVTTSVLLAMYGYYLGHWPLRLISFVAVGLPILIVYAMLNPSLFLKSPSAEQKANLTGWMGLKLFNEKDDVFTPKSWALRLLWVSSILAILSMVPALVAYFLSSESWRALLMVNVFFQTMMSVANWFNGERNLARNGLISVIVISLLLAIP
jgi:hypothetical protein